MKFNFIALLALISSTAFAASTIPTKFRTDQLQIGQSGSTANKSYIFDFGLGLSNPNLGVDNSTHTLQYNLNNFQIGDGTTSLKSWFANNGIAPFPAIQYSSTDQQWEFSNDGTNFSGFGSGSGSGSGINFLVNPGFETGVTQDWTNTGGTFAAVSGGSNLLIGKKSALFTASSTGQSFQSGIHTVPNGLQGSSCSASILYLGGDANLTLHATDGSGHDLGIPVVLTPVSFPQFSNPVQFPCVAGAPVQFNVESTGTAAATAFDTAFLGQNTLTQVSQAQYFGGISMQGSPCSWGNSAVSSYSDFSVTTGCSYATKGNALAPSTQLPAIRFASMPAGEYFFSVRGKIYTNQASSSANCNVRLFDGTNDLGPNRIRITATGASNTYVNGGVETGHLSLSTASASKTISIQMNDAGTGSGCNIDTASDTPLQVDVYYYPSQSQTAFTPSNSAMSWSGQISGCSWSTGAGSTPTDFPATTGCTLTQLTNRNFGTVTEPTNLPQIQFTPSRVGRYRVCASYSTQSVTGGAQYSTFLADEGNVIFATSNVINAGSPYPSLPVQNCGILNVGAISTKTIKLQGSEISGSISVQDFSANGSNSMLWTIDALDTPFPAPVVVGQVTSPSTGVEVMTRALIAGCSSDPCTIQSQSGSWLTAVNWLGTGDLALHIAPGTFSAIPSCFGLSGDNGGQTLSYSKATATSTYIEVTNYFVSGGVSTPQNSSNGISFACIGPK
jgi:hypothetical protein